MIAAIQRIRGLLNAMRYINSRFTYLLTYRNRLRRYGKKRYLKHTQTERKRVSPLLFSASATATTNLELGLA